jgi:hypothetical protein
MAMHSLTNPAGLSQSIAAPTSFNVVYFAGLPVSCLFAHHFHHSRSSQKGNSGESRWCSHPRTAIRKLLSISATLSRWAHNKSYSNGGTSRKMNGKMDNIAKKIELELEAE